MKTHVHFYSHVHVKYGRSQAKMIHYDNSSIGDYSYGIWIANRGNRKNYQKFLFNEHKNRIDEKPELETSKMTEMTK